MDVLVGSENRIDTSMFRNTKWIDASPGQLLEKLTELLQAGEVKYQEIFQNMKQCPITSFSVPVDFVWQSNGIVVAFYDHDLGMLYY